MSFSEPSTLLMSIADIVNYLKEHLDQTDITLNKGASDELIKQFEEVFDVTMPNDIRSFYKFTNGFISAEDNFAIIPLEEIIDNKVMRSISQLYIAEYMVYCDMWELQINRSTGQYSINYNIALTNSFAAFIQRFLVGGVFEEKGLYDWHNEIKSKS
jgi:cell wall assembly regulator SMI1